MKIWVISDLHLEFGASFDIEPPPGTDVVVCAGDVLTKGIAPSIKWLGDKLAGKVPVVFVAGNHEFYGGSIVDDIRAAKLEDVYPRLHFLENGKVEIDGVLFVGGTLWSDFRIFSRDPEVAMSYARSGMNDFKHIKFTKRPYRKFLPIDAYLKHQETRQYLAAELCK